MYLRSAGEGDGFAHASLAESSALDNFHAVALERYLAQEAMDASGAPIVLSNTVAFRASFGSLLLLAALFQLAVAATYVRHRTRTSLELTQPTPMALFCLASGIATAGCYLLIPENGMTCVFRQPVLLISLHLMGCVLVGRAWRIGRLLANPLQSSYGSSNEGVVMNGSKAKNNREQLQQSLQRARIRAIDMLTSLSNWRGAYQRVVICRGPCWQLSRTRPLQRHNTIHVKVPVSAVFQVVTTLTLPQLLLQVLNLSVPGMRAERRISYSWGELGMSIGRHECAAPTGEWPLALGVSMALVPYLLAPLLNLKVTSTLDVANDLDAITQSYAEFFVVLCVAGPALAMVISPDARAYLLASIILSLTLGLFLNVAWTKIRKGTRKKSLRRAVAHSTRTSARLRVTHLTSGPSELTTTTPEEQETRRLDAEKMTELGDMFFAMGRKGKAIECYDEALECWQTSEDRGRYLVGGLFTIEEVNHFSVKDIKVISSILLSKNKAMHAANSEGARAWLAALAVLEKAPAAQSMKDRSIIYPCYNGLSGFLGLGIIEQDERFMFEADMAKRFVRDAQTSSFHLARALAMQCEVTSRRGDWDMCFKSLDLMENLYSLEYHSPLIVKAYIQDRCAQAISMSILWYDTRGEPTKAQNTCDQAIKMAPLLSETNDKDHAILQMVRFLIPIIRYLKEKSRGKQARQLWEDFVLKKFRGMHGDNPPDQVAGASADILFRPIRCLLDLLGCDGETYDGMDNDIKWCIEGMKYDSKPEKVVDSNWSLNAGWSPSSLSAEVCLCFSHRLDRDTDPRWQELIWKGLKLARNADMFMKDVEGNSVRLHIPYKAHAPIITQLERIAEENGIRCPAGEPRLKKSSGGNPTFMRLSDEGEADNNNWDPDAAHVSTAFIFESAVLGGDSVTENDSSPGNFNGGHDLSADTLIRGHDLSPDTRNLGQRQIAAISFDDYDSDQDNIYIDECSF